MKLTLQSFYKPGVVLAGYIVSFLAAATAVYLSSLGASAGQQSASSGMHAFGDSLLFLGVFLSLSLIPTSLSLYFLRPFKTFWKALSAVSVAVAGSGPPVALVITMVSVKEINQGLWIAAWYLGVLRLAASPLLCALFLIASLAAPERLHRMVLIGSVAVEGAVTAYIFLFFIGAAHF